MPLRQLRPCSFHCMQKVLSQLTAASLRIKACQMSSTPVILFQPHRTDETRWLPFDKISSSVDSASLPFSPTLTFSPSSFQMKHSSLHENLHPVKLFQMVVRQSQRFHAPQNAFLARETPNVQPALGTCKFATTEIVVAPQISPPFLNTVCNFNGN